MIGNKLHHPNIHRPWSEWSEDQTLHVVSVYINPFRWQTRRNIFSNYIRHMRNTSNVSLHIVEVAFGDRPFEVTGEHEHDIQFRTSEVLWLKENAINLAVQRLPVGWKYAAYVDGDMHFTRHDWALEAIHQLQHYDFVQLFSSYSDLSSDHRPFRVQPSFAYHYANYHHDGKPIDGGEYCNEKKSTRPWRTRNTTPGATGGAWAWTRKAFDAVGGMLDTCILGAADWYMAFGLIGKLTDGHPEAVSCGPAYERSIRLWQERAFSAVKGNIGYLDNHCVHHWHGPKSKRGYGDRWKILARNEFDPTKDLYRDGQGLYQVTQLKPILRQEIVKYFLSRTEDDPNLDTTAMV